MRRRRIDVLEILQRNLRNRRSHKVAMALTVESEDVACAQAFSKMQLDANIGACDAAVSTSRRRRLVANTAYDVTVFVSPVTVNETALAAALVSLAVEGHTIEPFARVRSGSFRLGRHSVRCNFEEDEETRPSSVDRLRRRPSYPRSKDPRYSGSTRGAHSKSP